MTAKPHPIDIEVGRRVHALRRRMGLSRRILAEAVGVSFQQLQKYETGANRISSSRLAVIAARLGTSPAALFGEAASPSPSEAEALLDAFHRIADPERRRGLVVVAQAMADRSAAPLPPGGPSPA